MIDPRSFKRSVTRTAYDYWLSKCNAEQLPRRADINPRELLAILPCIFLMEVRIEPLRFRFRLVGTRLVQWWGQDLTGIVLAGRDSEPKCQRIFKDFQSTVVDRAPRRDELKGPSSAHEFYDFERLLAPLSNDGNSVDMILGAADLLQNFGVTLQS